MAKRFYILYSFARSNYGIWSSKKRLTQEVDAVINREPNVILTYETWEMDNIEPVSWEWAYIPEGSSIAKLGRGGGIVPFRKFFGHNLLNISFNGAYVSKGKYTK